MAHAQDTVEGNLPAQPVVGSYWTHPQVTCEEVLDGIIIVERVDADGVRCFSVTDRGMMHWTFSFDEFALATYVPDGAARRAAYLQPFAQMTSLVGGSPALEVADGHGAASGTALIDQRALTQMRDRLAGVRAQTNQMRDLVASRQRQMQAAMKEQAHLLDVLAKDMEKKLQVMTSFIQAIQGYLGFGIDLVDICAGSQAPDSDPIVIRQVVAFMDEEMAFSGKYHDQFTLKPGEDDQFDAWLREPGSIELLIPESKGIIGLRLSRQESKAKNPWEAAAEEQEGRWLHLLVKNGANLTRMKTPIPIGDLLVPRQGESADLFDHRGKPLRPGTRDYQDAMDRADARSRHVLRILLSCQGILDRSTLLGTQDCRINLCNPDTWRWENGDPRVILLRDGEPDPRLLGDPRPTFDEWVRRSNDHLAVGDRVLISAWADNAEGLRKRAKHEGTYPPATILTVEEGMLVRYPRPGYLRGTSCLLSRSDRCFLRIDAIDPEMLDHYLTSRLERRSFLSIIPLMRDAKRVIAEERSLEEPFLALVIREAGGTAADRGLAMECLAAWKSATRLHRGVTSDDAKAVRMVSAALARQLGARTDGGWRETWNATWSSESLVLIQTSAEDAIRVDRHADGHPWLRGVFLRRDEVLHTIDNWLPTSGEVLGVVVRAESEWSKWPLNVRRDDILTRAEADELVAWGIAESTKHVQFDEPSEEAVRRREEWLIQQWEPVIAHLTTSANGGAVSIGFNPYVGDAAPVSVGFSDEHTYLRSCTVLWSRNRRGTITPRLETGYYGGIEFTLRCYNPKSEAARSSTSSRILRIFEPAMQLYKEQFARGRVRKIQEYTIRNCIQRLCDAHSKPHREKQIADARDRFVAKGHDPHTWEPNKVNTTRAPDEEAFTERLRAEADQDPVAFLAKYAHPHD